MATTGMDIFETAKLIRLKVSAWLTAKDNPCRAARKHQLAFRACVVLALAWGFGFFFLGGLVHKYYYFGICGVIPILLVSRRLAEAHATLLALNQLRSEWGKPVLRERDFDLIAGCYLRSWTDPPVPDLLDDNTWADLDMNQLYAAIDHTCTSPGEVVLYRILRSPQSGDAVLLLRNRAISSMQEDVSLRESVQLSLARLGRERSGSIHSLIWSDPPMLSRRLERLAVVLALTAVASILPAFVWGLGVLPLTMLPVFAVNLLVTRYVQRDDIFHNLLVLRYLAACIRCAGVLGKIDHPGLEFYSAKLRACAQAASSIRRKALLIRPELRFSGDLFDILNEYVSVFFLHEVRTYHSVMTEIRQHVQDLRELYLTLGELDALQSAASFRASLPHFREPELLPGTTCLEIENGQHPLVPECVPNSIRIDSRGVIITGSNMAGKSTFLRTIAVNALLAQTLYTCYASKYRAGFFRILSSINTADQLVEGKSFFLKEAEKMLNIIRAVDCGVPYLCLVDELLVGTNSAERISASIEILKYLCGKNCIVIVSSHDLEIARLVQGRYDNYHFSDYYDGEGLHFDYRLKQGISSTRNAINLLEYMGYPKEIIEQARLQQEKYLRELETGEREG